MSRRLAGEDAEGPLYDDILPPTDPALQARPFSVLADLTIWATSPEEAEQRLRDIVEKARPEYRASRARVIRARARAEPVSRHVTPVQTADSPPPA